MGGKRARKKIRDPKVIDELIKLGNRRGLYADEDWHNKESLFNEPSRFYDNENAFYDDDSEWVDFKYLYKDGNWNVIDPYEGEIKPLTTPSKYEQQFKTTRPNLRRRFKSPLDQANALLGGK